MTRDEIISVMLEAGIRQAAALRFWGKDGLTDIEQSDLEAVIRFAALIEQRAQARTLAEPGELHRIVISWTDAGMTLNGQPVNPGILRLENSGAQYESAVKVDVGQ
jgi:hypothetical protein